VSNKVGHNFVFKLFCYDVFFYIKTTNLQYNNNFKKGAKTVIFLSILAKLSSPQKFFMEQVLDHLISFQVDSFSIASTVV